MLRRLLTLPRKIIASYENNNHSNKTVPDFRICFNIVTDTNIVITFYIVIKFDIVIEFNIVIKFDIVIEFDIVIKVSTL
jgi:hypothetical protein